MRALTMEINITYLAIMLVFDKAILSCMCKRENLHTEKGKYHKKAKFFVHVQPV